MTSSVNECDENLDETSPAGLSMSHWVDAYINVVLKTVVDDIKVTTGLQVEPLEVTPQDSDMMVRVEEKRIAKPQDEDRTSPVPEDEMMVSVEEKGARKPQDEDRTSPVPEDEMMVSVEEKGTRKPQDEDRTSPVPEDEMMVSVEEKGTRKPQDEDRTSPVPEDEKVRRYVDAIITESFALVLSREEHFVSGLVWEVLDKASKDVLSEDGFDLYENKLNVYAREFAHEIIQTAADDEMRARKSASDTAADQKAKSEPSTMKNKKRSQSPSKKSKSSDVSKPKGDEVNPAEDIVIRPGMDYIYVQYRLMAIFGTGLDSSVTRCVLKSLPEQGTWRQQFDAVDRRIRAVEREFKSGQPLMTKITERSQVSVESKKEDNAVRETVIKTSDCGEATTAKMAKSPSRTRRILMRMRNSLLNLRKPFRK